MNKKWLYRSYYGDGWTSTRLIDGISVDISFLTPGVDTRTWWDRDPTSETHRWGTRNFTFMTLNGGSSMLDLESYSGGWTINSRTNAASPGAINGLKLSTGYLGEEKWAGISGTAEDIHSNNTALSLYAGQSEKMRVLANGNVGIGTLNPQEKLSVFGTIRSSEVKVSSANWPDYVFEKGFKIGGLDELEKYIKLNKHLPEMPSAKEVEIEGIALGDMNSLLLKKIEELTLYLIEKDTQINSLLNANKKTNERLLQLEKHVVSKGGNR
ncbi:hypothetical protein [Pedobacter frigidisoli]|uniref:hypothetical protein n=1 Tax=Pedobacter frigidisoli TaxID=2530455 RepID=UPI00292D80BD|nr:hypothetical protein [Pedobacter frigidisoli]